MINGLGYKLANVPTVTGLSSVVADSVISGTTNTGSLILNGVDVSIALAQVPINTNNITILQQATTGITYNTTGDLTTIDNNVLISSTKYINSNRVPTTGDNLTNKTYVDTAIANLVDSAPATLDTLNELAFALGDDPNFATTVTNAIAGKASLSATQNITGATTMSNPLNVFYGDGSNLTNVSTSTIALTTDDSNGNWLIPFSKTTSATSNILYIDNSTTPLTYNANVGRLSATEYTIGSRIQTAGTNSGLIYQNATPLVYINNSTSGRHRFFVNNASNLSINSFNINSTNCDMTVPLSIVSTVGSSTASLIVQDSVTSNQVNTLLNAGSGAFNGIVQAGDNVVFTGGAIDTEVLTLTSHSGTITGVRITPTSVTLGSGATTGNTPNVRISMDGTAGTMIANAPSDVTVNSATNLYFQTAGLTRLWIAVGGASRFAGFISLNSTTAGSRQILNTYYNLHDTDTTAGGTYRAQLYSSPTSVFLDLSGVNYSIRYSGNPLFTVTSTTSTCTNATLATNTTNTAITNDSASSTYQAITFTSDISGNMPQKTRANVSTGSGLTYLPSTNVLNVNVGGVGTVLTGELQLKNNLSGLVQFKNSNGSLEIINNSVGDGISLQSANGGTGVINTRLYTDHTSTIIYNKVDTRAGIIAPGPTITYTGDMIGYTIKKFGTLANFAVTSGTIYSVHASGTNGIILAPGMWMITLYANFQPQNLAGSVQFMTTGLSTDGVTAYTYVGGTGPVSVCGSASIPANANSRVTGGIGLTMYSDGSTYYQLVNMTFSTFTMTCLANQCFFIATRIA